MLSLGLPHNALRVASVLSTPLLHTETAHCSHTKIADCFGWMLDKQYFREKCTCSRCNDAGANNDEWHAWSKVTKAMVYIV